MSERCLACGRSPKMHARGCPVAQMPDNSETETGRITTEGTPPHLQEFLRQYKWAPDQEVPTTIPPSSQSGWKNVYAVQVASSKDSKHWVDVPHHEHPTDLQGLSQGMARLAAEPMAEHRCFRIIRRIVSEEVILTQDRVKEGD